ncbi:MAG TPA: MopE-related protein, partial [Candidatus Polarisedimenticolia bacterium]|nr:MopE-related protein [Candidatus Polarisedimenticolia bacterium]
RYNPATNTWVHMSTLNAPEGRFNHPAVWTGSEMLVWGGEVFGGVVGSGGRYDPATDTWQPITGLNAPEPRRDHAAVWTGGRFVVFGGIWTDSFISFAWRTGGRYDPATDTWTPTASTSNGPTPRAGLSAIWTGSEMILWGGCDGGFNAFASGKRYDPVTDSWQQMSMDHGIEGRCNHAAVWTGDEMLVWSGQRRFFNTSRIVDDGARYDPVSDHWEPMSSVGAPQGRALHSGVWTGDRMIVWGGAVIGGVVNSGGVYDPASDTWSPTSTLGAPEGRFFHSALWTGEKMIVWGGDTGTATAAYGNGGVYDPVTDKWQPTSLAGAPSPRASHAAAWTGREMFVFSGVYCAKCQPVGDGSLYDPALDTWRPISQANAPPAGFVQRGLWTGREVLVWGSQRIGGRYDPQTESWRLMSTDRAPATRDPRAVWTGTHMLVWGEAGRGGRYIAFYPPDDDGDGVSACDGDCDDTDARTNPDAAEVCDGADNDCDGVVPLEEADLDGDGFRVCGGDCDDTRAALNPDAPELPGNIVDENCDGEVTCDPTAEWKNRGQLVGCVARACENLVEFGAVTREACDALIARAARLELR